MRFRAFRVDWDTLFFRKFSWARSVKRARAKRARCERSEPDASVLVRLIVSKFHKKSFTAIILFFRNCVCCERLWPLRPSNLVLPYMLSTDGFQHCRLLFIPFLSLKGFSLTNQGLLRSSLQCLVVKEQMMGARVQLEDCIIGPRDRWTHPRVRYFLS